MNFEIFPLALVLSFPLSQVMSAVCDRADRTFCRECSVSDLLPFRPFPLFFLYLNVPNFSRPFLLFSFPLFLVILSAFFEIEKDSNTEMVSGDTRLDLLAFSGHSLFF